MATARIADALKHVRMAELVNRTSHPDARHAHQIVAGHLDSAIAILEEEQ